MSETNYFRLIEEYFDGNISIEDKLMLKNQLGKDPLLQAEFKLQKHVNQGLSKVRQQQLKQRLSAIKVAPVSLYMTQSSAITWLASTVAAATLLGSLLYWISGNNTPIIPLDLQQIDRLSIVINKNLTPSLPSPTARSIKELERSKLNIEEQTNERKEAIEEKINSKTTSVAAKESILISIKPQALLSFEDEKLFVNNTGVDMEKMKPIDIKISAVKETSIEVLLPQQINKFHYQYYSNKLFLYGDFDEEPYEIIELKQKGHRKLFLSYKDSFYVIEADKIEITQMQSLNDKKLLNELEMLSNSK
jgi:hypothetical protein